MVQSKRSELMDVIRRVAGEFREAGGRFLNRDIVDTVIGRDTALFNELGYQLAREKLFDLTRRVMKSSAEITEAEAQLCLGLDLGTFRMIGLIAVPVNAETPLSGDCEWVPVTQATVADLDANLGMLDEQIAADRLKRRNIYALRQSVVAIIGEDSNMTVAEAAAVAAQVTQ